MISSAATLQRALGDLANAGRHVFPTLMLLLLACSAFGGEIHVRVTDLQARPFDYGVYDVDLLYGEDKDTAVIVNSFGYDLRGKDFLDLLKVEDLADSLGMPRRVGGQWTKFSETADHQPLATGQYWVSITPTLIVRDEEVTEVLGVGSLAALSKPALRALGLEEGMYVEGPPAHVVHEVTFSGDRLRVVRDYIYTKTPIVVPTHLAKKEEVDTALVIIPSTKEHAFEAHETFLDKLALEEFKVVAGTVVELGLEKAHPVAGKFAKLLRGGSVTLMVDGLADLDGLISIETGYDVATGAIISLEVSSAAPAFVVSLLVAGTPPVAVGIIESLILREGLASDDIEAFLVPRDTSGKRRLAVINHGPPIYNLFVTNRLLSGLVSPAGDTVAKLGTGERCEIDWSPDDLVGETPVGTVAPIYALSYEITLVSKKVRFFKDFLWEKPPVDEVAPPPSEEAPPSAEEPTPPESSAEVQIKYADSFEQGIGPYWKSRIERSSSKVSAASDVAHTGNGSVRTANGSAGLYHEFPEGFRGTLSVWHFIPKQPYELEGRPKQRAEEAHCGFRVSTERPHKDFTVELVGNSEQALLSVQAHGGGVDFGTSRKTIECGWHKLEIRISEEGTTAYFDGDSIPGQHPNLTGCAKVEFYAGWACNGVAYWDDFQARGRSAPETAGTARTPPPRGRRPAPR